MVFKSLDKLFTYGVITTVRKNNFLCKLSASVMQKAGCHSKTDKDSEEDVKKLLDKSSPLKPVEDDLFASEPYPQGTVFQTSEPIPERTLHGDQGSIILFPGQGNQFVGMAKNLLKYSAVQDMFATASEILGYDLLKVCLEGPEDKLNRTEYCQPATYVCSLGALEILKDEKPWAISNCTATCGYSLGEISALVFAGVIRFEEGLKLLKVRAKAMELCCKKIPGGMLSVIFGPKANYGKALQDAVDHCVSLGIPNPCCATAIHLFAQCKVIAGNTEALNFIIKHANDYGFKRLSKLPVSGAFHTALMEDAAEPVRKMLEKITLHEPLIKVYSNVTGKKYANAKEIRKKLPVQIYRPVKWEHTMIKIYNREKETPFPFSYECGPGNSLSVALRKINNAAAENCFSVQL